MGTEMVDPELLQTNPAGKKKTSYYNLYIMEGLFTNSYLVLNSTNSSTSRY